MNRAIVSRISKALVSVIVLLGLLGCWKTDRLNQAIARSRVNDGNESAPVVEEPKSSPELIDSSGAPEAPLNVSPLTTDTNLVQASTRFGFKLFSKVLEQSPDENVFISPTSVAIALTMLYNGAEGETQQAMAQALELNDISLEDANQAIANLQSDLEDADPEVVKLSIANSLWAKQGIPFKPAFLTRNQNFFSAKITHLDFRDPSAPNTINKWVDQKTEGRINQVINEIDPEALLFLVNAIYFKGSWSQEFDAKETVDRPFYRLDGTQKQHPMMSQSGEYKYLETEQFQAVSLPYGSGRLSMYIFLPKQDSTLPEFQTNLNAQTWSAWITQFQQREGSIQLPRFQLNYSVGLNAPLEDMGMGIAFDAERANFNGISPVQTLVNRVQHKTFLEVNEVGTEAAGVTSIQIGITSVPVDPPPPFRMVIDRPFFSAIRDNQTGAVLFMGSIIEPQ
ncbi:MAG: serpin family protein [Cyanothece sp. SIO1E1]|nr:serpin family protein [Cyanothece sp. SIO1E1]